MSATPGPTRVQPGRLVLLGHPVAHSLSPVFQNAALAAAGISARYEAIDVSAAELPGVIRRLVQERAGGNVTIPHKEAVAALCTRRTAIAERVGAVNTFWCEADGALVGDNTDVGGFDVAARALLDGDSAGRAVALLGAGMGWCRGPPARAQRPTRGTIGGALSWTRACGRRRVGCTGRSRPVGERHAAGPRWQHDADCARHDPRARGGARPYLPSRTHAVDSRLSLTRPSRR
jgi:hypothetical protein